MAVNVRNTTFKGILLYRKNYNEHDMLVKFFTAEAGPKMFLVRGANKANFKMAGDILPFSYGDYVGTLKKHGLSYLNNGSSVSHFKKIEADIYLNAYSTYIMSLVDAAFEENESDPDWFSRLYYALNDINEGLDPEIVTNIIEVQLLPKFGVAPNLKSCVICGETKGTFDYSEALGGLLCAKHFASDPKRMHLDQKTIYYLRLFSVADLKKIKTIKVNNATKRQLRAALDKIYENSVGLNLKSKQFLKQMKHWKINLDK